MTLPKRIIYLGISGTQGSGKTTLSMLISKIWSNFYQLFFAFADPLKRELAAKGVDCTVKSATVRAKMQEHGAFQRERFGPDYWINQLQQHCQESVQGLPDDLETLVIQITDIRLPEEAEWFRSFTLGAPSETRVLIRIDAPEKMRAARLMAQQLGELSAELAYVDDETERYISGITPDFLIINDSTTSDLETRLSLVLAEIEHHCV